MRHSKGITPNKKEENTMKKYQVRISETGCVMETFDTFSEAKEVLLDYEGEDRRNGEYEKDYYEVYNSETGAFWCSELAGYPESEM